MSLVKFAPTNHPQQVGKRGASDTVDERITPDSLWRPLHDRHAFTVDVAANTANAKLPRFYDRESDGLEQSWADERVWCNPPYSNIRPWIEKAWREVAALRIVMLLPANRTEQKWWQELVEPFRDADDHFRVKFLPGRLNFGVPGNETGKWFSSSPFGCCLAMWDFEI